MLRQPRQLLSAGIAIVLGIAFVAATLVFGASLNAGIRELAAGQVGDTAVVITTSGTNSSSETPEHAIPAAVVDEVAALPTVSGTRTIVSGYTQALVDGTTGYLAVSSEPPSSGTTGIVDGRWPAGPGEVAVNEAARDNSRIGIGTRIGVADRTGENHYYTVVGVARTGHDALASPKEPTMLATAQTAMAIIGQDGYTQVNLTSAASPTQLRDEVSRLSSVKAAGVTVRTGADQVNVLVKQLSGGSNAIQNLLLGFAAIALFVGAIVITNTFEILVTQRIRQLALLRCVGATRRQVFRMVVGEAVLLGLVGSAVGLGLGFGLAAVFIRLSKGSLGSPLPFTVSPAAVLVPLVVGVLVTTLASLTPARNATRVAPLAALRPELAAGGATAVRTRRLVSGLALVVAGAAMLVWGASRGSSSATAGLAVAMAGGALSFVGVLVLGRLLVPALTGLLARPIGATGVPGELAVGNSRRNPRRTAATASALLIGVTLIGMLSVGAAASQATLDRSLSAHFPQDAVVVTPQGADGAMLSAVRASQGVSAAAPVPTTQAEVSADGRTSEVDVSGVTPEAAQTTRFPQRYLGLDDDTARTSDSHFRDGQQVTLSEQGRSVQLVVRVSRDYSDGLTVSLATMTRLSPGAQQQIWVRYADGADADRVTGDLGRAVSGVQGAQVVSGAQARALYQQIIDIVLTVATGLLAVAVIIAVVGVANTLGLSVLERTQEIGLLRATGMTRHQVRAMIGLEAVTVSVVAVVLGLALGIVYGLIGAKGLMGATGTSLVVSLPWARLALIAAVALAAGWVASLAPSARAVRISPSAALSTE